MREFGKYSIVSPIGSGGMAEVFLAKSYGAEGLEKRLVLKRILPEFARQPKFVSMFIDEAKVAVSLNHPNIVQVYEFGKVGNDYYLALEYVDGIDLGRALTTLKRQEQRLDLGDAVYIAIEVAKALDYAHRKADEYGRELAIVHRDVSPQNILLTWDGSVKLVDFGIAKARHTASERSGVIKGKMSYMSPEQARGQTVDERSDVFGLGAVLYEMVAGRAPFPRGKPEDVLSLVRAGVIPDASQFRDDLPGELSEVLSTSLSANPDERYPNARELQLALTRYFLSTGEIRDAGSLAETLTRVREGLAERERAAEEAPEAWPTVPTAEDGPSGTSGTLRETASLNLGSQTVRTAGGTGGHVEIPFFRERRETFVVVGELHGLAELRGELPDDRWRSVLFDYIHLVQSVGYKNACAVDRVDERGFLLLAGVPVSSENDAETAVRVARDLIEALDAMSVNLVRVLSLTVGIARGGLILERVRDGEEERFNWSADEPDWEAARQLAKEAMAGEILVDGLTHRRTRRAYSLSVVADMEIAPLAEVYRLDRPKTHRERLLERRKSFTTLHGRDFELRLLRQSFQEARRKSLMRTVVFLGDPGVGKATIVEEFLTGLAQTRATIVRAACSADYRDNPYMPITKLVEDLLGLEGTSDLRLRKRKLEGTLEELLADYDAEEQRYVRHAVAMLLNVRYPENIIEALEPERRRARLFLSLRRLLGAPAKQAAAVLVVNDIQWADVSSMDFLAEVVGERRKRPMLLVLTARSDPRLLESRLWRRLTKAVDVTIHQVADLAPHSARALIQDLADGPLDPALIEQIVERSGGNPLFIKEILESLVEEERLVLRDGLLRLEGVSGLDLPPTVEGIVAGRIGSLPSGPKVVLLRCSLIGREMDEDQLRAVFGEVPQVDLDRLVERGFLRRIDEPDGTRRYRFAKGLTRDVAAKALLEEERTELHARLAEHLIERESDLAAIDLAAVARHLEAAGEAEDAGQYFLLAAATALDTSGLNEALTLVDRALVLLGEASDYRYTALDLKEKLLKDLGRNEEREHVMDELRRFVDERGPREHKIQVLIRMGRLDVDMGRMEQAEEVLGRALTLAGEAGDARGRAAALAQLTSVLRNTGRSKEAREVIEEALAAYEALEAPEEEAIAWNQLGILNHQDGRLEEALGAYEKVVELARKAGLRSIEEVARINIGYCLVKMGDIERAVNTYRQVLHEILQLGHRRNEAALLANLGHAQVLLGDFARAEHTLRRCIRLSKHSSDAMRLADGLLTLAVAYLARGRLDEAAKAIEPGLKAALESQNNYLVCHGYLLSSELKLRRHQPGDLELALADAEHVLELASAPHLFAFARAETLRARCLWQMDRKEEALAASERSVEVLSRAGGNVEGAEEVYYHHALLLSKSGQIEAARTAIEGAHVLVEAKRDRIQSGTVKRTFGAQRGNRKIEELWERLREA